jgi:hypothetical protein
METVEASGEAVCHHQAFGRAFEARRGGTTPLIGQEYGRLFRAQIGDGPLPKGTVIACERDFFGTHSRASVSARDVLPVDASPCRSGQVGKGGEPLFSASPAGNNVKAAVGQPVEVGIRGALRVKKACVWPLTATLLPIGDTLEHLVSLLRLTQRPMRRAKNPGVGLVRQKGPPALLATAALGDSGLLPHGLLALARHGMAVQSEGGPVLHAPRAPGIVPQAHAHRGARRGDPTTLLGQKGTCGHDVEAGKEGQAFVKDRAHDLAVACIAKEVSGHESPPRLHGGHVACARHPRLVTEVIDGDRRQRGHQEQHATARGAQRAWAQVEPTHIGDGRRRGPGRVGACIGIAAGSACTAVCFSEARDGDGAQAVPLSLEGLADIGEGEVLLAHGNDGVADGVPFWGGAGACAWLEEERSLGVLAALVAEHAETPGRIAKALGDRMRREPRNTIGP